jgi:tetratricopeptide (TPR) repeat protein
MLGSLISTILLLRERQQTRVAAAESNAVVNFLVNDLIAAPVREIKLDRNLTVGEVLANAEPRISKDLVEQPLVEATVRYAMAKSYLSLQKYDKAEPHARRALELRTQILGPTNHETLQCTTAMVEALVGVGKKNEARRVSKDALTKTRAILGPHHPDTIDSLNREVWVILAGEIVCNIDRREIEYAKQLNDDAYEFGSQYLGREDRTTLQAACDKAFLLLYWGKENDQAEQLAKQTLDICETSLGPDDVLTLSVTDVCAQVAATHADRRKGAKLLEEVLARQQRLLGDKHPELMETKLELAMNYNFLGRYGDARKLCDDALKISINTYGSDDDETMRCKEFLADVVRWQTTGDEACKLAQEVLKWRRQHLGPENPETLDILHDLAFDYFLCDRPDESIAAADQLIEIVRRVSPTGSHLLSDALDDRALALEQKGEVNEARKTRDEINALQRRPSANSGQPALNETSRDWAALLHDGEVEKARIAVNEAIAHISANNWRQRTDIAWSLATHPSDKFRDGSLAVDLAVKACELTDRKTALPFDTLAAAYAENGNFKSAVEYSEKALELATPRQRDRFEKHLNAFRSGKPWREVYDRKPY